MDKIEPTMSEKIDIAIDIAKMRLLSLTDRSDMQKCGQSVLNLKMAKSVYANFVNPSNELDEEISFLLKKVRSNSQSTDMQQVTQAVLSLMQAKAIGEESQQQGKTTTKRQGAGV
jgi:poly-D-alanine transfer protein DltD